jgi:hypothetical protein
MAKNQKPKAASAKVVRPAGPSAAKLRRIEAQRAREQANRKRRTAKDPTPWELADLARQQAHNAAVADGSWNPVRRTELGFLVRHRSGGGLVLEDPGAKIRKVVLEARAETAKKAARAA